MSFIYIDTINAAQATQHILSGTSVVVTAVLDSVAGITTGDLVQNAISDMIAFRGAIGSSCPGIDAPNFLESITPEVVGAGQVKIRLSYKGFPTLQIEIGTCLSTADANKDKDDKEIFVEFTYPKKYLEDPRKAGKKIQQGGFIQRAVQETTFQLKYLVTGGGGSTASSLVLNFAQTYVGMVNKDPWGSAPGAARTWLCESVRGISRDGGLSYEVTVTFHYRKKTWDFLVVFINPDTGKPPKGLKKDSGYKLVRGYDEGTLPVMPPS